MALTAGPRSPSTAVNEDVGNTNWSSPTNVLTQNDTSASATIAGSGNRTDYLKATNFGFTIPAGATISGILVEADLNSSFNVMDGDIRLVKGGVAVGDNKDRGSTEWPTSDTDAYVSWGSISDLWGTTWTAAEVNASTFGVILQAENNASSLRTINIDHVRITITYEAAQEVALTGIASSEAFGTLTLTSNYTLSLTGIPSAEAFGTPTVFTGFQLVGIDSSEAFGALDFTAVGIIRLTGVGSAFAAGSIRLIKSKRDKVIASSVVVTPVNATVSVES